MRLLPALTMLLAASATVLADEASTRSRFAAWATVHQPQLVAPSEAQLATFARNGALLRPKL
jgi:hypothetical protein